MNKLIKHKLFISIIKWIPVVVAAGILISNTLVVFGIDSAINILIDYFLGVSFGFIITIYSASVALEFCNWHRIVIWYDTCVLFLNYLINNDYIIFNGKYDILLIHYVVAGIFIIILTYNHVKVTQTNKDYD